MYFDTPRDYLGGLYEQLLYGDQPLGWDIIGRKETVRGATRETFLDYLDRWYQPTRLVVGVGGKFERRPAREARGARVGLPARRDAGPGPRPARLERRTARDRAHEGVGPGARLASACASYPIVHPDRYALQLLSTVLGGGMSSRLFTEVRERRGLAYYVYGVNNSYTDAGSLYSQAGVDINRIDEAVETIVREIRRIAEEPVPEDELEKARNFAKGRFVLQLESPHGTIMFGLRREVLEGHATEPTEVLEGLDAVTVQDLQRVAQDVIGRNALNLAADRAVRRRRALRAPACVAGSPSPSRSSASPPAAGAARTATRRVDRRVRPRVQRAAEHDRTPVQLRGRAFAGDDAVRGVRARRQGAEGEPGSPTRRRSRSSAQPSRTAQPPRPARRGLPRCARDPPRSRSARARSRPSSRLRRYSASFPATWCARASASYAAARSQSPIAFSVQSSRQRSAWYSAASPRPSTAFTREICHWLRAAFCGPAPAARLQWYADACVVSSISSSSARVRSCFSSSVHV